MTAQVVALIHHHQREKYVNRRQLAEILAVSPSTIDRWRRAGMPSDTWGQRIPRFLPSLCIGWARARGLRSATGTLPEIYAVEDQT